MVFNKQEFDTATAIVIQTMAIQVCEPISEELITVIKIVILY